MRPSSRLANSMRRGFTMLEITIVLVVLGVVGAMSAGRIHDILIAQRVASAATTIQNGIESAFALASRNRLPVDVSWNSSAMTLNVTDRSGTVVYKHVALGADAYGLASGDVSVSRSPVEIYPNGLANDTLTISLRGTNVTRTVRVSRAGLVRIQ